jgi:hypothetical protein
VGTFSGWNTPNFDEMAQLMVSPSGAAVAYVEKVPYSGEQTFWGNRLYTTRADGLGTEQLVNIPIISQGESFVSVQNPRFSDDDTLIFTAGPDHFAMDLYRFRISTSTLDNLTGYGDKGGADLFEVPAMWWAPERRYLYYIEQTNTRQDMRALDLASWKVVDITHNASVLAQTGRNFIPCSKSGDVFFAAMPEGTGQPGPRELFRFDQANPATATQLTTLGLSSLLAISVSPACSYVAFEGSSPSGQDVLVVGQGSDSDVRRLLPQTSQSYVRDPVVATEVLVPDDESLVAFVAGPSELQRYLYVAPLVAPGPAQILFNSLGDSQLIQLLAIE